MSESRLASPAEPSSVDPVEWADSAMEKAQVFASAWSLVGGRFDFGTALEDAERAKDELRQMLFAGAARLASLESLVARQREMLRQAREAPSPTLTGSAPPSSAT